MAARLSVPYCIAAAAVDREVTQRQFQPDRYQDPMVCQVLERTEVIADAELNLLYPKLFPARVKIELESGETHEATVMYPKGDPKNPPTDAQLEDKFRDNASALLTATEADAMVRNITTLSDIADVSQLMNSLENRPPREEAAPENTNV